MFLNESLWQVVKEHFAEAAVQVPTDLHHRAGFEVLFLLKPVLPPHLSLPASFISLAGDRPGGVLRDGVFYPTLVSRLPQ